MIDWFANNIYNELLKKYWMNAVRLKSQHTRPEVHQWRFSSYLLMETGCLGWVVSYLPWPNNIHRGPTLFGTLKSFFLHRMGNQPGWIMGAWDMEAIWLSFILSGVQEFGVPSFWMYTGDFDNMCGDKDIVTFSVCRLAITGISLWLQFSELLRSI